MIKQIMHAPKAYLMFGFALLALPSLTQAQNTAPTPVIRSLIFTPDARSGAMADAGVAIDAQDGDANSLFWNAGKMPFSNKDMGFSLSYTPWLRQLVNDMALLNGSFYKKFKNDQVFGASIHYFDMGLFQNTDNSGNILGNFNSKEYAINVAYARKLSEKLGLGVTIKYINSSLFQGTVTGTSGTVNVQPINTVAADIGLFHTSNSDRPWNYNWGISIQNISGRVSYVANSLDFIPTNLKVGFAAINDLDQHNKVTFTLDLNKLMVPTPTYDSNGNLKQPATAIGGILGSFGDAPGGLGEELREISASFGTEYLYNNTFALRAGYRYEDRNKGNQQYATFGIGVKFDQKYGLDFSYLVPSSKGNPLAQTIRLSLHANLNTGKDWDN